MKILVYGAGPLGSIFAAHLTWAGHDVSILARNQRLRDLNEHGIVLEDHVSGERTTTRVNVVEALGKDDYYDMVMIIMRKNQAEDLLPILAANERVPTYLFMMNNAAGPDAWVEALGKERVMMGFPLPGGERDGHAIRIVTTDEKNRWPLPIGEVDGRVTDRTRRVANALRKLPAYKVQVRRDMDRWLKHHVALIMPAMCPAMYAAGTDLQRMARTRDALVLAVRGMREAILALRRAGYPESPAALRILHWIPEPILVWGFRRLMKTDMMKTVGEGHAKAARDEMKHLADEFLAITRGAGVETPICDELYSYYDPKTPEITDGRRDIALRWTGLWAPIAAVAVAISAMALI